MADNDEGGGAAATEAAEAIPPKKGKLKLIIAAVGFLVIIGGGVGGWMLMSKGHGEKHAEAAPAAKPPVYVDVPEIMVNLAGLPGERVQYLKVKVVLEIADALLQPQIQTAMPRVMDTFQTYLRELRPTDLDGSAGLYRLKEELTRRVNAAISPNRINAVLFKEIVVQ